jgi:hypothetical protein
MTMIQKARSVVCTVGILLCSAWAQAATGTLTPVPYLTIVDASGATVSGACIWTYVGGTSTPVTTWTDKALSVPNTNPVVANSSGQAVLYLQPGVSYKYTVETACTAPAHGTTIRTQDNIDAVPATAAGLDVSGTAGEALTAGQAVYLSDGSGGKTAGLWYKADSTNAYSSTSPLIGMAPANISAAALGSVRLGGQMTGLAGLVVGASYYVSTGGALVTTTATGPRRLVGQADSITTLLLASDPWVPFVNTKDCSGRLTLTTAVPVTTADVTGASAATIYWTPFRGNRCAVYDGTAWTELAFAEISVGVPATTATMYDVFVYNNSGVLALEFTAWTNDTTRATALALQDGVYIKSGTTTRRYLGSFRTGAVSGQTEDSVAKRYLWNYYNRAERGMQRFETTTSWTYTSVTLRQANAATANQLDFVIGVSEDAVDARVSATFSNPTSSNAPLVTFGLDSTTVQAGNQYSTPAFSTGNNGGNSVAVYVGYPGAGRHTLVWLEAVVNSGTAVTFVSNTASVGGVTTGANIQSGLIGRIRN